MVCCVIPYDSANSFCVLGSSDEIKLKTFSLDFLSPPCSKPYQLLRNEKHLPSFTGLVLPRIASYTPSIWSL